MSQANWHEVVPKIVDPELAPQNVRGVPPGFAYQHTPRGAPGQQNGGMPGHLSGYPPGAYPAYGGNGPEKPRGFFQEHKFAIIVAVVVLAVVLVVLYLYLSQKGKRGDKGTKGRPPPGSPPGSFGAGAGDGGDGPGASEEERINNAELQKAFMMRQAARAAQQRAGRRPNDGAEPEGFGPPWQGGQNDGVIRGDPQMPPPSFDAPYPPYGSFGPRAESRNNSSSTPAPPRHMPSNREDTPPTENTGPWNHVASNGQPFAQPRGPPEANPNRIGREPFRPADSQQNQAFFGANTPAAVANPSRMSGAVDVLSGAPPGHPGPFGQMESRRVTWADGGEINRTPFFGRGGGGAAFAEGRAPQGGAARVPKTPAAPEGSPMVDGGSGLSVSGNSSLFQQLATSLEDEASGGQ